MPDSTLFIVATAAQAQQLRPFLKEGADVVYVGQEVRLKHLGYRNRVFLCGKHLPMFEQWYDVSFSLDTDPDAG